METMIDRSMIFTVGAALVALVVVLELVRRRHLSEEYSLLWLGTAVVMLALGIWRDLLHQLAAALNIFDPTNLLFLLALLFLLFIQLYFSMVITRLTRENKEAAQQIALLQYQLAQSAAMNEDDQRGEGD
ncbi:MAG: DUF2304 domain-containing protein [Chloroflexi bacterium]|nr:DUF2304 domain-containing protein [Chloroflexota bacterium]MCY3581924.1 DUF2304 domain-containing protein [Chloroflexota bacterium]MCY3716614.1 DUF2304 domain-containing protein [Chloroflexota bacterium]MDE2650477.1 DUF2304 domain-containing protein [Chloroflexota bacterium]MXX50732.1 DUF2304 domain-containing protein [Chloroflexota bacterium]